MRNTTVPVETTLYDLLGVHPAASEADIKKAYKKKAREHHPDKNIKDPLASQKFQEMAAAYEILVDAEARATYDELGVEGLAGGHGGAGGMDPSDFFSELFGDGFHFDFAGRRSGRKSQDAIIDVDVTLEDLYNGKTVKMNLEKDIVCSSCKGTGGRANAKPKPCIKCQGKGWVYETTSLGASRLGTMRTACSECDGEGEKFREKERCKKCKGEKTIKDKKRQEIFIEKGMTDRQRIVLAGEGDQVPGEPAGDVTFVLHAQQHDSFERAGNDLLTRVKITLSEALLGFSRIIVTHLDGRGLRLSSPPGKVIKSQDTVKLTGEGMPIYRRSHEKGDLYVVFELELPTDEWLSGINRQALQSLLPPKKPDLDPPPPTVDEVTYNEADIVDFGEDDENEWTDDEDEGDSMDEPECRPQ